MAYARTDDGIKLYYEEAGDGTPIIWVHEFAGDWRSWESQMRFFSRRHRCITFSARGYLPSDVPHKQDMYSQERAARDIACVLDAAKIDKAHIVGLSMGGFATLHFGLMFPERALSLTVAGSGYGAEPAQASSFVAASLKAAEQFDTLGSEKFAPIYASGASRVQLQNKDPRGWDEFARQLGEHDAVGSALTMRGVQARRPSLYSLEEQLRRIQIPVFIVAGDEDDHCLQPAIYLKQTIPTSGLLIMPKTGHTLNLEEPDTFNRYVWDFLSMVESGKWGMRDPRATSEILKVD
ncbi:alpha/beta hydrolase [Allopusillimonas soli]|uniref:Alpha/beta hydrolase n=1 Tax=Allopusillimonas soli TaxID=659016 RepID=A0A853FDL1_9BURK|nr:alpha/beta hydrolase [Allopusillimonas soli]NYT38935.1 alpha/beta hydrolase [Allopusillimonas soli]TEA70071.1 alpha/beta hydrolase [Allopusillimonas soli]